MDDIASPRRPHDPPWRSRTAHRNLDPEIARMLADARTQRGWSAGTAAASIGCGVRMLRYLEAGQRVPSTALAEDIISAYGLDDPEAELLRAVALPDVGRASPYRVRQV